MLKRIAGGAFLLIIVLTAVVVGVQSAHDDKVSSLKPAQMSYDQVAMLLHSAGVPDDQLATVVAVGAWESRHTPRAFNDDPETGDLSYGLYQINMIGSLGPARLAKYGLTSNEDLYDPEVNVRIMMDMSNGGKNLKPWGAYTNDEYKKCMGHAEDAAWNVLHPDQPPRNPGYVQPPK